MSIENRPADLPAPVAAVLHQAAALATGNGDLLVPEGLLDWRTWAGSKVGQAESLRVPSPADLLEGKGMLEQQHGGHTQTQSRGAKL
jgi:hypothetical protein